MVQHPTYPPTLGATLLGDGSCRFLVWAPQVQSIELKLLDPEERLIELDALPRGYYEAIVEGVEPGTRYFYRLDGERDRPDPASRFQPDGVHNASAVVQTEFDWTDQRWAGIPLHHYITYELHIGTFTEGGTFDSAIERLDDLVNLGVTAVEPLPVAQFPGGRNWGYDGVHPFAVQNTYGGPEGLKRFVNAAHEKGLAVIIDAVYNHIGPEGNYLSEFGHYFTDRHHTPWGQAMNFDDRDSDEVRRYFLENALFWINECHADALRLDAVHAIFDTTARTFLEELADAVRIEGERLGRRVYTIAESSLADPRLIEPVEVGGSGLDAQWCDDMHHAIRTTLLDEQGGYYADYGGVPDLVKAYREGFVQDGEYSEYRGRRHGRTARHLDPVKLVVCSQNHDQVGNRLFGERLTELVSYEELKLAAATVLLSPCQPMLFMGEEYAEPARFQFFISHTDPGLVEAVRKGRKEEFRRFAWKADPPDPQSEDTFNACKLNHELKADGKHAVMLAFYKRLIELRKSYAPLLFPNRDRITITDVESDELMVVHSWSAGEQVLTLFHYGDEELTVEMFVPGSDWTKQLDSAEEQWNGPGSSLPAAIESAETEAVELTIAPHSVAVYASV